jgi:putative DNA methylase
LLRTIDWKAVDAQVRLQQRNRERHTPPISMFRWWARRSHALIGALLEQTHADNEKAVISDPFSGGGTVAIEAARRALPVYAQDLHPWPIAGLRSALTVIDPAELERASESLLGRLAPLRARLYGTDCPRHGSDAEVLGCFWVRVTDCHACAQAVHLFPYPMLSRASREAGETHSWWGCSACGRMTCSRDNAASRRCSACGKSFPPASRSLLPGRRVTCPHRGCRHEFPAFVGQKPQWKCVLVQRSCRAAGHQHVHLDRPTAEEEVQASDRGALTVPCALREEIPHGLETRVLRRAGVQRWEQLYTPRQLRVLAAASEQIEQMRLSTAVRDRLRLSLAGCAEMAGHVSRWDRFYPKAFEATANHRFAITGFSYETNLLAERGRGSFPRRLRHSESAARWSQDELPDSRRVRRRSSTSARQDTSDILLAQGSSARQLPRDGTVDLVLTDPPYFDDVQYAELASIFLAWARACKLLPDSVELDLRAEAVANPIRGAGAEEYRNLLRAILTETRRTLKPNGRIVLTYHNTDLRAWWALGSALRDAGLDICALAVTQAENERDHAKRDRLGFSRDLVLECRPTAARGEPDVVWYAQDEPEARELVAAGRALAGMPDRETQEDFRARFRDLRGDLRPIRIGRRAGERDEETANA